jgi:hypothetical protein
VDAVLGFEAAQKGMRIDVTVREGDSLIARPQGLYGTEYCGLFSSRCRAS